MKKFILFKVDQYYPNGGWHDFYDSYDTLDEARAAGNVFRDYYSSYHIVNTETWEMIKPCPKEHPSDNEIHI